MKYSAEVSRTLNMLCVENSLLKLIGVKRVYFQQQGRGLLDTLVSEIHASDTRDQGRC